MRAVVDINCYVEEQYDFQSDKLLLTLDETSFEVSLVPCDEEGTKITDAANIAYYDFSDFETAKKFYLKLLNQIMQGDVIRNIAP